MWPFKKKQPRVADKRKLPTELISKLQQPLQAKCPDPTCLCYDCPSRGRCVVEKEFRASGGCVVQGGPRIAECSWKKHLKGELYAEEKTRSKPRSNVLTSTVSGEDLWSGEGLPAVRG